MHKVEVPPKDGEGKVTMKGLLSWVKANLIKERPEMFVKGDSVYVSALPPFLFISTKGVTPGFIKSLESVLQWSTSWGYQRTKTEFSSLFRACSCRVM